MLMIQIQIPFHKIEGGNLKLQNLILHTHTNQKGIRK
jgi:hypothetical protein